MDEELKKLLEKNLETSNETLKLLKKIYRAFFWQRIYMTIKWVIVGIIVVISFIQLQPYIDTVLQNYENISQTLQQVNTVLPAGL